MQYRSSLPAAGLLLVLAWIGLFALRESIDWSNAQILLIVSFCMCGVFTSLCSGLYFIWVVGDLKQMQSANLLRRFPGVYRVTSSRSARIVLLSPNANVLEGDYGWQAESVQADELVYLHGLNEDWYVVWYAGFEPSDLEFVRTKPENQYNRNDWQKNKTKCPFKVQSQISNIESLGLPRILIGRWVQGVLVPVYKREELKEKH